MIREKIKKIGDRAFKIAYFIAIIGFIFIYVVLFVLSPETLGNYITIRMTVGAAFALIIILQMGIIINDIVRAKKQNG